MKRAALSGWALTLCLLGLLPCVDAGAIRAAVPAALPPATLLDQAEQLKASDHARFLGTLKQLHAQEKQLTPAQHWHLTYLDAWQWVNAANDAKAIRALHDIIDHSGDISLSARATAQLIQLDFVNRRYEQAYVLAGGLMASLPEITDPRARRAALSQVVQMMDGVGQYDLALKYARQMQASLPSATGQCLGQLAETQTLLYADRLTSTSPKFQQTIDACLAVGQVTSANALRLDLAGRLMNEGRMDQSIAMLQRIAPSIRKSGYHFHIASLPVTLAQNYVKQGKDAAARQSALAALAMFDPGSRNWIIQAANKVLYQVEKHTGHDAAALAYYEKYVAQDKQSADDTKARALAYQQVRQQVLAKKLRLDALSKQNQILQLRQSLADKASETNRLFIALLLLLLGFIVLWLFRLKHSQLRFRHMARHDDLTNALNRQHFLEEAERTLRRLRKAGASACLVMLDLDHFKQVNDVYGHAVGDEVLKRTVAICRRELRGSDLFGRLGGEEFGLLMPDSSPEQGVEIANRIRSALVAAPIEPESGTLVQVSASFGLARSDYAGYELTRLFRVADAALYRAKSGGRNRVVEGAAGMGCESPGMGVPAAV